MNKNLNCSASNCAHNSNGSCFAGSINVSGKQAMSTSETTCSSFRDSSESGLTNSIDSSNKVCTKDIHCEANNCKYNDSKLCKTDSVQINDTDASCETFTTK